MTDYAALAMKNLQTAHAMTSFSHDKYNLQTAQVYATLQLARQQEAANLLTAAQLTQFPVDRATLMWV